MASRGPTEVVGEEGGAAYSAAVLAANRMLNEGMSWSGHERNCCFLNTTNLRFANISATAGLDWSDDGRAFAVVDWDQDGDLDLFQTNRTAPQIRFLRNDWNNGNHFLAIRLEGTESNRDAIGARVKLYRDGVPGSDMRTLYAGSSFVSQSSKWVHFGLGQNTKIDKLVVQWPGGEEEVFTGLRANGRFRLKQGTGQARVEPRRTATLALRTSSLSPRTESEHARVVLPSKALLPELSYRSFTGQSVSLEFSEPTLLQLWASWCPMCQAELREFSERADEVRSAGVRVVSLSVDGLGTDTSTVSEARAAIQRLGNIDWTIGSATEETLAKLELLRGALFSNERPFPVPTSFLVDAHGRLAMIYLGPVEVDQLLEDAKEVSASDERLRELGSPFPGRWFTPPKPILLASLSNLFKERGFLDDAKRYQARVTPEVALNNCALALDFERQGNLDAATKHYQKALQLAPNSARINNMIGRHLVRKRDLVGARRRFLAAIQFDPTMGDAYRNIGATYVLGRQPAAAIVAYRRAVEALPRDANAHLALGRLLQQQNQIEDAERHLRAAIKLEPTLAAAFVYLGIIHAGRAELETAIDKFETAIRLRSDLADAHLGLGQVFETQGKLALAANHYRQALGIQPDAHVGSLRLAWLIATNPEAELGSAEEAKRFALRVAEATKFRSARPLFVLAATHAHAGEYEQAISLSTRAMQLVADDKVLSEKIRQRLQLYKDLQANP